MTMQIAQTVLSDPRLIDLHLLFGTSIVPAGLLDQVGRAAAPPPHGRLAMALRAVPGIPLLRRAGLRARLSRQLAALTRRAGGRVLYHEPNMIARPFRGTTVTTINDLSWHLDRHLHPPERINWIERGLPATLRQAVRIVAISQFTKHEAQTRLGIDPARIDVVPLAPSQVFTPQGAAEAAPALASHELVDRNYILSVSTLEPRKNFDGLLTAYLHLPAALRARMPLAIAGGRGWGSSLAGSEAKAALACGQLRLLGHVPDEDLRALYARSACFAFVSHYEGFGLPVIEAMACGSAVVASNTTAVAEVAGEAAITVNPADPAAITEALRAVLEDPAHTEKLRAAGLARAAGYTWEATADRLFASWQAALDA
jgi:alpha-1,3-rhamnosyl/mannosyltransferase